MISQGLFEEMSEMLALIKEGNVAGVKDEMPDYTRGILQSIGFKEFHEYMQAKEMDDVELLKSNGIERMKIATRQYATKQVTWLKNKLCRAMMKEHSEGNGAMYILDATDLSQWDSTILPKALRLAKGFIDGKDNEVSAEGDLEALINAPVHQESINWKKNVCDVCEEDGEPRVFNGDHEWKVY